MGEWLATALNDDEEGGEAGEKVEVVGDLMKAQSMYDK